VNKQLLILGGGFGLYGYLPAALEANWQVSTLERYRNFLNNRAELLELVNQITFVQEESLDLDSYHSVVVARNPMRQFEFVQETSDFKGHYFLEKPIGATLDLSLALLKILQTRESSFSIGYLFRYQDWYRKIVSSRHEEYALSIDWKIPRVEKSSWKNDESFGGGLLSYYGIHLLSLIVELGVQTENLQVFKKQDALRVASLKSSKTVQIDLSTADTPAFSLSLSCPGHSYRWRNESPFGSIPLAGAADPRIPALVQYLSESREPEDSAKQLLQEQKILRLRESISQVL
jgi:hypothetical protein